MGRRMDFIVELMQVFLRVPTQDKMVSGDTKKLFKLSPMILLSIYLRVNPKIGPLLLMIATKLPMLIMDHTGLDMIMKNPWPLKLNSSISWILPEPWFGLLTPMILKEGTPMLTHCSMPFMMVWQVAKLLILRILTAKVQLQCVPMILLQVPPQHRQPSQPRTIIKVNAQRI